MLMELKPKRAYESVTIAVDTPTVSPLFVTIVEDEKKEPIGIHITAGKAGYEVSALASAMSQLMTAYLNTAGNKGINGIIESFSGNKSNRYRVVEGGIQISSIPEGITWALHQYRHLAYSELKKRLGFKEDGDDRPRLVG